MSRSLTLPLDIDRLVQSRTFAKDLSDLLAGGLGLDHRYRVQGPHGERVDADLVGTAAEHPADRLWSIAGRLACATAEVEQPSQGGDLYRILANEPGQARWLDGQPWEAQDAPWLWADAFRNPWESVSESSLKTIAAQVLPAGLAPEEALVRVKALGHGVAQACVRSQCTHHRRATATMPWHWVVALAPTLAWWNHPNPVHHRDSPIGRVWRALEQQAVDYDQTFDWMDAWCEEASRGWIAVAQLARKAEPDRRQVRQGSALANLRLDEPVRGARCAPPLPAGAVGALAAFVHGVLPGLGRGWHGASAGWHVVGAARLSLNLLLRHGQLNAGLAHELLGCREAMDAFDRPPQEGSLQARLRQSVLQQRWAPPPAPRARSSMRL